MVRIYNLIDFNINLVKTKMHEDSNNNKKVNKLAKLGVEKEILIVENVLLLHNVITNIILYLRIIICSHLRLKYTVMNYQHMLI